MEQETISRLLCENMKAIFSFSVSRTKDRYEAEALASDILYELYRSAAKLRDDSKFFGYMWRIAENVWGQNADKILALSAGGDDYIEKPFDLELLLVKIKAILRRTYEYKHLEKEYLDEDTSYDIVRGRFVYQNKVLELTKSEGKIMSTLLGQRGNWVTREQLMMTLWNTDEFVTDATLSVHISRLRNKLKELTNGKDIIKTKKGVGYYID